MIFKSVYVNVLLTFVNLINPSFDEKVNTGTASFYAKKFEGKRTSSGQRYRAIERTAAHRSYPFGTLLEIINRNNGLKTIVRVNDRGPHVKTRLIDLSYSAAKDLGLINSGTASVTLKVISLGEPNNIHSETSIPVIFSAFVPELLKKKYQYMTVVKQSDGNANIVYSDVKQQ